MNVFYLGGQFNGVGGFIDISQSIEKISFCFRKNKVLKRFSHISFRVSDKKYIKYLAE
ncbi:conserved hypothetical protein [Xenorhabdus bovienii str. kraussei Quebec]|uniref:Uncharacterized protein n=1 Tax=Xenorhabdus bovienii str. kraussei Quebec TaxID=1398203 RepID=A0A077PGL8_XENBV|nr:conserved hypothetical protein [Xenorhabdus bovienii str. kraussei Quebec]